FHIPKLHLFHRITALFPAFAILVTLYNIDTIWNHGLIENPQYNRFNPDPEQPRYIRKSIGERLTYASFAAGSCAAVVGLLTVLRRRVVRTISFRTDQPRHSVTGHGAGARALRMGHGRRMVSLTSASGAQFSYPITELELGNAKRSDTLLLKAHGRTLPFFFEVDQAQVGWPGVSSTLEPFKRDPQDDKKVTDEKKTIHERHAKQLFGLLWKTHMGVDLSKTRITDPWADK
ncbi:hypothetical protein M408DRAFT_327551, partial [Serendipita vermifera MAFF 305830]